MATVSATVRTRGSAWMAIRKRILKRDGYICRCDDCMASGVVRLAQEVDHITELADGGTDADDNLMAINSDCHKAKTLRAARARAGR